MHLIGGIALGTFAWIVIDCCAPRISIGKKFWLVVGLALFGGLVVEVFEFIREFFHFVPYAFSSMDTLGDLLCDTLGGVVIFMYYYFNK